MSIQITHWLRAFLALQQAAFDGRGETAILDGNEIVERWPRTTGDDAIAIAALVDPSVRRDDRAAQFWRPLSEDLARFALADGARVYQRNQSFWQALLVTCVELHANARPLPSADQLDALVALLLTAQRRNASPPPEGPFKKFDNVKTFDDLYNAQFIYLRDLRGTDEVADASGSGGTRTIPRTTNGDVILLADFWDKQFQGTSEPEAIAGTRAPIATRWTAARADVEAARTGDPNGLYAHNNAFWRAMREAAIYTATSTEAPSKWDLAKAAIAESVTHLPENLEAGASAAAKFVGGLAHEMGKVANEAGKGLFSGFGTPVLIGAGLIGLFLVTRKRGEVNTKAST